MMMNMLDSSRPVEEPVVKGEEEDEEVVKRKRSNRKRGRPRVNLGSDSNENSSSDSDSSYSSEDIVGARSDFVKSIVLLSKWKAGLLSKSPMVMHRTPDSWLCGSPEGKRT